MIEAVYKNVEREGIGIENVRDFFKEECLALQEVGFIIEKGGVSLKPHARFEDGSLQREILLRIERLHKTYALAAEKDSGGSAVETRETDTRQETEQGGLSEAAPSANRPSEAKKISKVVRDLHRSVPPCLEALTKLGRQYNQLALFTEAVDQFDQWCRSKELPTNEKALAWVESVEETLRRAVTEQTSELAQKLRRGGDEWATVTNQAAAGRNPASIRGFYSAFSDSRQNAIRRDAFTKWWRNHVQLEEEDWFKTFKVIGNGCARVDQQLSRAAQLGMITDEQWKVVHEAFGEIKKAFGGDPEETQRESLSLKRYRFFQRMVPRFLTCF